MTDRRKRIIVAVVWSALGAAFVAARPLAAQPEPSAIPTSWELKLDPSPLMRISVDTGGGARTYWYMLYTVSNHTGDDIDFHPEIVRINEIDTELTAEQARQTPEGAPSISIDPAIVGLDSRVFAAIARRHARTHPFLVTPVKAITRLLQGQDNALTGVAVFPDLDPRVSRFTIYFGGLSGEVDTRPNPLYRPKAGDQASNGHAADLELPRVFVLRKSLAIPYTLPGDLRTRRSATPVLGRMTWVMR
jgi:hypothetical protein